MPYSLQQNLGTRELKNCSENDNEGAGLPKAPTPSSCVANSLPIGITLWEDR
jgi:hypothetical protein